MSAISGARKKTLINDSSSLYFYKVQTISSPSTWLGACYFEHACALLLF